MEAQLQRPSQEAGLQHSAVEGGGQGEHHHHDHHGEKKSVLKKVKEKAKKMKDAIKKHGHHTHHQLRGESEGEEEDPEVHGAPIVYESTVVRTTDLGKGQQLSRDQGINANLEKPPENMAPRSENLPAVSTDAIGGKNSSAAVASKQLGMGYSGGGDQDTCNKPLSHKVAETLAPVYEKVAGAGSAVMAMVAENGGGDNSSPSMKEYVSEKLRPGEEDKKLSEAITDAIHKKKEAVWGTEEEEQQQQGGKGRVKVSKEVAERLGTVPESKREGEDALSAGEESSGQGVAERVKDAVGSWLGKSCGIQTAEESVGNAFVNNAESVPR